KQVPATWGKVPLNEVLDTGLFDYEEAEQSAGWIQELESEVHTPETDQYGISSFVYRTHHPFDAVKFWDFLHNKETFNHLLRSKGYFWVAANHHTAYEWAQAGGSSQLNPAGLWWAAMPREDWPHPPGERPDEKPSWDLRYGDRLQQLVFIGQNLDQEKLRNQLDACLLDPKLTEGGSEAWATLESPFPDFEVEDDEEDKDVAI
nr:GTP-binding protein [Myxococcales bacterium]